jgi:hypothetical protein
VPVSVHASSPRFLFFWNNKVASRSILHALEGTFPGVRTYPQPAFRPPAGDGDWPRFLVVRDPWARAVSCYRNKCRDALAGLKRNGGLEPCQKHLLVALGAWPSGAEGGARRLAGLSFADFAALLPAVRDGNSHFRLQGEVLLDAAPVPSRAPWLVRASGAGLRVARTHYLTPALLAPSAARLDREARAAAGNARATVLRLEDLPDAWTVVEDGLGVRVPLPWHTRTATDGDWKDEYDPATSALVGRTYAADVAAFGYQAP